MNFTKEKLTIEEGLKREWIITNRNWRICCINNNRGKY
jgi:hypothetical protein